MYPFLRLAKDRRAARRAAPLGLLDMHVSRHRCLPWDLDPWNELNNGRTLTLYDLGRLPLALRTGLLAVLKREGWGLTVAGSVVRYRRRVRLFDRLEMRSRLIGWDRRFLYLEQAMWKPDGDCASHALYRAAITDASGIVAPDRVLAALGQPQASPDLPDWVTAWIAAEALRPWPPMAEAVRDPGAERVSSAA